MSIMLANLFHRAGKCPIACLFKFLLFASFIFALDIAAFHQTDVSAYLYILLVALVVVVAILALAFHWSCRLRIENKRQID